MEAIKLEESVQARFKHAPELVATFRNVGEAGDFPDKMCWFVYSTCELASPRPPVSATQRRALHTATPPKHADAYRGEAVLLRHMRYGLVDVQPPRYTHADAYEREAASLQHMRQGLLAGTPPHKARSASFLNKRVSHAFECHSHIHSLRVRSGGPHARASEARHVGHCVLVASHARMQASWKWCLRPPSRPRWNGSRSNISLAASTESHTRCFSIRKWTVRRRYERPGRGFSLRLACT